MKKLVVIATSLLLLSGCSTLKKSVFGDDNSVKPHPLVAFHATKKVTPKWQTQSGNGNASYIAIKPAVSGNILYSAGYRGDVTAINRKTGKIVWQANLNAPIESGPAVGSNTVVVGTGDAKIIALNKTNGHELWRAPVTNEVLAAPTIAGNKVLAKSSDGNVFAFSIASGKQLWRYDHGDSSFMLRASGAPAVANGLVVAGFADGKIDVL